jgi:hypothetical protein
MKKVLNAPFALTRATAKINWALGVGVVVAALGISPQASASVNLVVNGGFETGDFTGWTRFGNTSYSGVSNYYLPSQGNYSALFGAVGSLGGISQSFATVSGSDYEVSFDLANGGGPTNEYLVQFGSSVLAHEANLSPFGYQHFSYITTAASSSTTLALSFRQDPSYFKLDGVSVTAAVPEPEEWAMMAISIPLVGWKIRRKQKKIALML